ncbi:hypothetical protein F4604DRAFT_1679053 [Suillus subluteus]|nr:hypothetical protein F4604DRAFT_1679053 [Suillus subluteus]
MSRTIPNHNFIASADDGRTIDMGETCFFPEFMPAYISLTGVYQLYTNTLLRLGSSKLLLALFAFAMRTGVIDGKGSSPFRTSNSTIHTRQTLTGQVIMILTRSGDSNRPHAIGPYYTTARIDSTHESTYYPPT